MDQEQQPQPIPTWFWIVSVVALIWNLMGCGIFLTELFNQEAMMESMTEEQKEWVRSTPAWVYWVFGVSVISGLLGSVLLLMRNQFALLLLIVSLLAVIVQMGFTLLVAGVLQVMGPEGAIMPTIVTLLAIGWVFFAAVAQKRQWLR